MSKEYFEKNKRLWNAKTDHHVKSEFYENEAFLSGKNTLKDVELALLGDVKGKSILHLQCHFGQDTLSLARMGAQVTGLDISDRSIEVAQKQASELGLDAEFVCSDVYSAKEHINNKFDIVFTSYGTIGWLPDMDKWADIVAHFIKPGGQFVFAEFHPVVWMFDYDFEKVEFRYFNSKPIIEFNEGTYADREADIALEEIGWNHSLGEVITALLVQGLTLNSFKEYDYSTANCFNGLKKIAEDKYIVEKHGNKLPLIYSLLMTK